ncbi:hypothetical protein [Pedobacter agri]|uniref:IPTL-CTERM protein sorting domain-containing protein n=1 Tax=Pedobacter agri TaxID=454586 RepID=A0A9X3I6W6_9SPHI|nr:hypothetical protein [Pedobacter agri]MCX3263126.1 hypothetical protein [Pedobacter agri]
MKKTLLIILLLNSLYAFAQPLTSTPAGCAITVGSQYRVYQITFTSFGGRPTYQGTGGVRYTTWTDGATGVDRARLTCITLNTGAADACYVKTGTGTTSSSYTSGTATTFTVNTGTAYNESGGGTCTNVPIDGYVWILLLATACAAITVLRQNKLNLTALS